MAVNDNAHLSLAELQQMAAYQQQQHLRNQVCQSDFWFKIAILPLNK